MGKERELLTVKFLEDVAEKVFKNELVACEACHAPLEKWFTKLRKTIIAGWYCPKCNTIKLIEPPYRSGLDW